MDALQELSAPVLALIAIMLVAQLALMIWALVDLVGRPAKRVRGPKWMWAVIIVLGELVGPIVYLVVARLPETVDVAATSETTDRVTAAADVLYGPAPDAAASTAPSPDAPSPGSAGEPGDQGAD